MLGLLEDLLALTSLATVQKIARLYGGRTWTEETPGGGSTFRVEMADGVRNQRESAG